MPSELPAIHVVSLPGLPERRHFMQDQLDKLGIVHYKFFDAIHGKAQPDHYLFQKYDAVERARIKGKGNALKLSQLGCFASHYLLWEKCVQSGQPIIILEDDAILMPNFMNFYEASPQMLRKHGLIWMHASTKPKHKQGWPLERIGAFTLKKLVHGHSGTAGYLISPDCARAMMGYCSQWIYAVDDTMARFFHHKIEAIGLDPVCVVHNDDFESTINEQAARLERTVCDRARREYANLKDAIKRTIHNILFYVKYKPARNFQKPIIGPLKG
ncbi:hypothetical protein EKL30_07575 [Candidimonas sp. SYP-B2681]|uniref:glycosyltransferase family 25 protein n=1 Tax=Candidimonas sp. SYP-B2681 TaxID=2497686 RepID=UPI000F85B95B|nr:glycosyltransferase family 25 protein [Candidimonas sp. SYP-B2681]RTZ44431.1 hypothetical protein EKL30_07575 [Candidimonas sp. SYP-B2681]